MNHIGALATATGARGETQASQMYATEAGGCMCSSAVYCVGKGCMSIKCLGEALIHL